MASLTLTGGTDLRRALADLRTQLGQNATLKVGFPEGAKTTDGKQTALIAFWQNFGAPAASIPRRPFFTNFANKYLPHAEQDFYDILTANGLDIKKSLGLLGEIWVDGVQHELREMTEPKLSPITIMLRKMRSEGGENFTVTGATVGEAAQNVKEGKSVAGISVKPLIDTGNMLRSVTYWVGA